MASELVNNTGEHAISSGVRFSIIGSNISNQIARRLLGKRSSICLYAPKISLGTAFSDKKEMVPSKFMDHDAFRKKIIERDAFKTLSQELIEANSNVFIFDFLNEIFSFLTNSDGVVLTNSDYLPAEIKKDGSFEWKNLDREFEECWEMWKAGLEALSSHINSRRVFLVISTLPSRYEKNGSEYSYSPKKLALIERYNSIVRKCNELFMHRFSCEVLHIPQKLNYSTIAEDQGFSLNTLPDDAYIAVARQLSSALGLSCLVQESPLTRTEALLNSFGAILQSGEIPTITELHKTGNYYLRSGDIARAEQTERLITLIRNSSVPLSVSLGRVSFGYGGIGVVVHAKCEVGDYVTIGSNVTLGGGATSVRDNGHARNVPYVEHRVYIATGAKILGGIIVGHHSIIGANAVCLHDIPPYSVVAGNPAKIIRTITRENFSKYITYLYKGMSKSEVEHRMFPYDINAMKPNNH